ncbi:hypothetical protein [Pyrobaculum islandicum]|nr:hypothetical protein [Pyrobaculum islandicum]
MPHYSGDKLQVLDKAGADGFAVYGVLLRYLAKTRGVVHKRELEEVEKPLLKKFGVLPAMAYNDLRRLGVISVGRSGDWDSETPATLTQLGAFAVRCVWIEDNVKLGAILPIFCRVKNWPLDPGEAGYCIKLYNQQDAWLVEAIKLARPYILPCLPYGAETKALTGL